MNDTISIKKNVQFKSIYKRGKCIVNKLLVIYIIKNRLPINKLGIVVNKKVGNAVVRNRVRRLIKENYRLKENQISKGYDIIFVSRVRAKDATYNEVDKAMKHLLKKAGLIDD